MEEEYVKYLTATVHAISVFVLTDWPGSRKPVQEPPMNRLAGGRRLGSPPLLKPGALNAC